MKVHYPEIEEVLTYIHEHLSEPLSLSDLANQAAYSPFHFSRLFKKQTGLSPHQYVASLKLQRAKDLLLNTNLTVRDIGMEIDQQSLGTFTTRFTERVGMTPVQFRKSILETDLHIESLKKYDDWSKPFLIDNSLHQVEGTIESDEPLQGVILIGLFPKPIPEGLPSYGTLLSSYGRFCFQDVNPGIYNLMATAVAWNMNPNEILVPYETLRAKAEKPIRVGEEKVPPQQLHLRGPRIDDPPILISLPLLMKNFLSRTF